MSDGGEVDRYDEGYDQGFADGRDDGYDDGYADAESEAAEEIRLLKDRIVELEGAIDKAQSNLREAV